MIINSATIIYFSPTGTTKKIINSIVRGMDIICSNLFDLTSSKVRNAAAPQIDGDIVLIGVPVYEERIPKMLYPFLNSLKSNKKPVVIVAVYGNIGDGIVLNELNFITKNSGFKLVAAGSFIGEHSFSTKDVPIEEGRPNYEDLRKAEEFGRNIMRKMEKIGDINDVLLEIPQGKLPLIAKILPKNSARIFTKTPIANMNICNNCGACAKLCPMNAINKDTLKINENECIRCFCCVKRCPKKARQIIYKPKFLVSNILKAKSKIKKNPQIYL